MADIPEVPGDAPANPGEPPGGPGTVGFVADVVRKAVLTGVGALFLTEEGARKVAREWKLPKDLATYLVSQAAGARDEVLRVVAQELRRLLDSETFRKELLKSIENMTVEIHAEMRLKASDGEGASPPVKVRVKRRAPVEGEGGGE
ncbi:MAG TPA: hypothetical protein PLL32_00315 [Anaeromyxobacteraceae bacterium]|nr:hypothetical protein [Anaeromyxobacteraceae bacterium]